MLAPTRYALLTPEVSTVAVALTAVPVAKAAQYTRPDSTAVGNCTVTVIVLRVSWVVIPEMAGGLGSKVGDAGG